MYNPSSEKSARSRDCLMNVVATRPPCNLSSVHAVLVLLSIHAASRTRPVLFFCKFWSVSAGITLCSHSCLATVRASALNTLIFMLLRRLRTIGERPGTSKDHDGFRKGK